MKPLAPDDVDDFLSQHNIDVEKEESNSEFRRIIRLRECPFDSNHKNGDAKLFVAINGNIGFACKHDSCSGKNIADFIKHYEPDFYKSNLFNDVPNIQQEQSTGNNWDNPILFDELPPVPAFPVHCLPDVIRMYVEGVAKKVQCPVDVPAVQALGVISICCQGKFKYTVYEGRTEDGVNLYSLISLPTGERKTGSLSLIRKALDSCADDWNAEHQTEIDRSEAQIKSAEGRLYYIQQRMNGKRAAPKSKKEQNEPLDFDSEIDEELPLPEQYAQAKKALREAKERAVIPAVPIAGDSITPEAMAKALEANRERIGILTAEGGLFDILAGLYTGNKAPNIDLLLKAYSGEEYKEARAGREGANLKSPYMTLCLSVQPITLKEALDNPVFMNRGLLPRFALCAPASLQGHRFTADVSEIDSKVKAAYWLLIEKIFTYFQDLPDDDNRIIKSCPDAEHLFRGFTDEIELKLPEQYYHVQGFANRFSGNAARIAALIHAVKMGSESFNRYVTLETMKDAIEIERYFMAHTLALLDTYQETEEAEAARYLWERIKNYFSKSMGNNDFIDFISKRDLLRLCGRFHQREDEMRPALDELIRRGYVKEVTESSGKAGRPAIKIFANMSLVNKVNDSLGI